MGTIPTFDPGGELPTGRLAIEASAGTGKTFAIATLAARFVAEHGVPVGELLVVTFTRAAAAELKDRVRARLVEFADALESCDPRDDRLLAELVSVDRDLRLARVRTAIADFDATTISTIHGFAQQVLGSLGSAVRSDPDGVLADDTQALVYQVVTDLLAREAILCRHGDDELPDLLTLVSAVELALGNPAAVLVPDRDPQTSTPEAALSRMLVDEVVDEVTRRRDAAGVLSFDDLLVRLRDALLDPSRGRAARQALRRRYRIALIDEFQDTDPVQWAIFEALFGGDDGGEESTGALTLVGDPKQAIYGFRSADVHTYLEAAHASGTELVGLRTNWRSDGALLRALEVLLTDTTFGDDLIGFQPVRAAEEHRDRRISTADGAALPVMAIRLAQGPGIERQKPRPECVKADPARSAIYADLAQHVRRLLESAEIPDDRSPDDRPSPRMRALRPDDVAVLVAANWEGPVVRDALRSAGIPAVITRGDNVLESEAAEQWHLLLNALARPADPRRSRAFALSWFVGWNAERLAGASDIQIGELQEQLHRWGELLEQLGVAAFLGTVEAETGVAARVLSRIDGDRAMTDLEHIAELLHLASPRRTSPVMLLSTFEGIRGGDEEGDPESDLAARRVESEADAVQIMTTYVAKGLEFPVVCCPSLWATAPVEPGRVDVVYWDPERKARTVDVAAHVSWPDEEALAERCTRAVGEAVGSNLRVLYVALTRARHHTAVWWAPVQRVEATGLARVLFARHAGGTIDPDAYTAEEVCVPHDRAAVEALAFLRDVGDELFEVEEIDAPTAPTVAWSGRSSRAPSELRIASLDHYPDRACRRWSFTLMTSREHSGHEELLDPLDASLGDAGAADELQASVSASAETGVGEPVAAEGVPVPDGVELPWEGSQEARASARLFTRCWSGWTSPRRIWKRSSPKRSGTAWHGTPGRSTPRCWCGGWPPSSAHRSVPSSVDGRWRGWGATTASTSSSSISPSASGAAAPPMPRSVVSCSTTSQREQLCDLGRRGSREGRSRPSSPVISPAR